MECLSEAPRPFLILETDRALTASLRLGSPYTHVWNYDPIARGLKPSIDAFFERYSGKVWNYDPIARGLKPLGSGGRTRSGLRKRLEL